MVSSAVTMAVPFGIGRVIDIIYAKDQEGSMTERLTKFCKILLCVFVIGAVANFGRVYLMSTSGKWSHIGGVERTLYPLKLI